MTQTHEGHAGAHAAHGPADPPLTAEELSAMSTEDAMIAAAREDGVLLVHRRQRFPVPGTKAERRAELTVAACFLTSFLAVVAFIVCFVAVPFEFRLPGEGSQAFRFYTPLLGATLAVALFAAGIGAVLWAKWLMPEEEAIQDRHDGPANPADNVAVVQTLLSGLEDTGLKRRSMIKVTLGLAGGALAAAPLVSLVGGMIKNPGDAMFTTLWTKDTPMVYDDGRRVSPDDLEPGGVATVFPGVEGGLSSADSPVLLIRLQPGQRVAHRENQGDFGWGDYVAYSKICTHAGCPASLYERQTSRLLCPCHQSQFDVLRDARPVFGPATRSLPKLPIDVETVDGKRFFISRSDFTEAIGPGFWERP